MWKYTGHERPPFAETPGPGQESVWDYPRPPKLVADHRRILVQRGELLIADSVETYRVLETAGPPTFYVSPRDVRVELLKRFPGTSICEWKGVATYWTIETSTSAREAIAWSYAMSQAPYGAISGYFSFYPGRVECFVDNERVGPQPGYFYGGWITDEIVGPWKGAPGTESW
ncbi:MAG TPA: DUF427 domain-containing protein [Candidatus Binatia bacterium]|nr:DUF427 domain-containing protein [Candidatus Binatia bacterium]